MSSFQTFPLSGTNLLQGQIFSELQKQVIQNEIAQIAEQIISLNFDPTNPHKFVQDDSFLKGQIQVLQYLLTRSEEAKETLKQLAIAAASNQS